MQEKVYQHRIKDTGELRWVHCVCMGQTWPASDSDWHGRQAVATRLHAYVKAKGGYFKHSGLQPALINFD